MTLWQDFLGAETRFVDTPTFGPTRIIEAGKQNPETLILMHGLGGHVEAYCKNINPLAEHFHVIAFDFIGHGLSPKPLNIEYTTNDYTQQLLELMDAEGIDKAHIAGESMGGAVAGLFVAQYPERAKRLIMITSGGIPIVTEQGQKDLENLAAMALKKKGTIPDRASIEGRYKWLLHEANWGMITDELIDIRLGFYTAPETLAAAPHVNGFLQAWAAGEYEMRLIPLEEIETEILFLWTEHNPMMDLEAAYAAFERVKNGSMHVIDGDVAHWPQYEAAERFNRVLTEFITNGKV